MTEFNSHKIDKCAACGAVDTKGFVVSSSFGAFSDAICFKCLMEGREVYQHMVNNIACAGPWPDGINVEYQAEVRRQLKLHHKTEDEFKADVERVIALDRESEEEYFKNVKNH